MKTQRLKKLKKQIIFVLTAILFIMTFTITALADMVFIEAESGKIDGLSTVDDSGAFGGKAIQSTEAAETVEYNFNIADAGTYLIWARVKHENNEDNSYFYSLDGSTYNGVDLWIFDYYENSEYELTADTKYLRPEYNDDNAILNKWYWIPLTYRDAEGDPVTRHNPQYFEISAGSHTLLMETREVGALIDKLIITNDLDYAPHTIDGDPEAIYLAEIAAAEAAAAEAAAVDENAMGGGDDNVHVEPAPVVTAPVAVAPQTSDNVSIFVIILMLSAAVLFARRRAVSK